MRLTLSGTDWQFKGFEGEDWVWRDSQKPDTRDVRHWQAASVPGSVHHDLLVAGEIPNPYFERNSLLLEWIPARTWVYKKAFRAGDELRGKRVQLVFEGVDYEAQFFLNGDRLGDHVGMYTPAVFEVGELLRYDADNLLAVVIEPAPHEQPQVGRTSKVRTHKSRMTYWWDFCPRMIHAGIWQDVYLNVTGQVRIADAWVQPKLSDDHQRAELAVTVDLDALEAETVDVDVHLTLDGALVAEQRQTISVTPEQTRHDLSLTVEQPRLWYPNGYGDQPLYDVEITVTPHASNGAVTPSDRRTVRVGIRKVELVANESADPSARPYTFVVNGRRVYIKGWNWVPLDVMYGVPQPDKLDHLLELARRAHVNLLRVWGGGLIETEAFYERCDRLGIMVWQEFIQSSSGIDNNPPTDPAFIDFMVREAEQIIPRKRNHPSLVMWCGGNELTAEGNIPLDDSHPMLGALKSVVERLDPERLWLPTSPTGRVFGNELANIEADPTALHDVHGPWEYQGVRKQYELYNRSTSLLHSEFGVEGITNLKTLNATIAPEHQLPVSLDNVHWHHLGAWWVKLPRWREVFGNVTDVETLVRATQWMQAEGLRYALEADQRRKYQNSGTLPWQFNEPYPMAASTSAVDYYRQPKPAYYAVAQAYSPLHVSAKFASACWDGDTPFIAEIWGHSALYTSVSDARLNVRVLDMGGQVISEQSQTVTSPADSAVKLAAVSTSLDALQGDAFLLEIQLADANGALVASNRYTFTRGDNLAPLLTLPPTELHVETEARGDQWSVTVTNTGNQTALGVWLEDNRAIGSPGYALFDSNYLCLLPQESRVVIVDWGRIPAPERALDLSAWNAPRQTIASP